jgi:hypothetical protein
MPTKAKSKTSGTHAARANAKPGAKSAAANVKSKASRSTARARAVPAARYTLNP